MFRRAHAKIWLLKRKLLVNADDLGLSTAINSGIFKSHAEGIVTSTSLVASGQAFDDAVRQARLYPHLGIGVHLTLVEENSVCAPATLPTLAANGVLPRTYGHLMKGILSGGIRLAEIERELRAQIEKCLAAGLKITHLDSHQHTHTLPLLFPRIVKLAADYAIAGIRIPRGWPKLRDVSAERFLPKCILCLMAHADAVLFSSGKYRTTDHFTGLFESGKLTEDVLQNILNELGGGTTELCCHPACNDLSPQYAKWNQRRQVELATLTSATIRSKVQASGIELINYAQL